MYLVVELDLVFISLSNDFLKEETQEIYEFILTLFR